MILEFGRQQDLAYTHCFRMYPSLQAVGINIGLSFVICTTQRLILNMFGGSAFQIKYENACIIEPPTFVPSGRMFYRRVFLVIFAYVWTPVQIQHPSASMFMFVTVSIKLPLTE